MSEEPRDPAAQHMRIMTADAMSRGVFSNNMMVTHTGEEFILDWLFNSPNGMHLASRIIVTPGHLKRVIEALSDNLRKYENTFGEVGETLHNVQQIH